LDIPWDELHGLAPLEVDEDPGEYAAQIFAEMLGLVCHKDFIGTGTQMVRSSYELC